MFARGKSRRNNWQIKQRPVSKGFGSGFNFPIDGGRKEWKGNGSLSSQTSGRPVYDTCGFKSRVPRYGLAGAVVWITDDGACSGYVDGSEGS